MVVTLIALQMATIQFFLIAELWQAGGRRWKNCWSLKAIKLKTLRCC